MITSTGILVVMLAYAALTLGAICLIWHLRNRRTEPRRHMSYSRMFEALVGGKAAAARGAKEARPIAGTKGGFPDH
jgi:hypothetical protein